MVPWPVTSRVSANVVVPPSFPELPASPGPPVLPVPPPPPLPPHATRIAAAAAAPRTHMAIPSRSRSGEVGSRTRELQAAPAAAGQPAGRPPSMLDGEGPPRALVDGFEDLLLLGV